MKKSAWLALVAGSMFSAFAWAQAPEVTLARIDCGTGAKPTNFAERHNDTFAFADINRPFTFSCYLIRHGDDYMVWDTGFAPGTNPNAPKVGLAERLAEVNVRPDQVKYVGISHYHQDHTGQLGPLTNATLLIGKGDWDGINANPPMPSANVAGFKDYMGPNARKVEPLALDKDVFGDGTVLVIRTPGHTPGHMSALVRLRSGKNYLLSGDAVHYHENYESNGVPSINFDRSQTLASIDRLKKIAANLNATLVIQHDMRDIGKLPAWPAVAK
ncbi:MAG: N-acyl homoserine lactonase family protein [Betaproteobacteria bacterium]|nr:N-acyl homoserine lactonase family protein [Betaproteobacteria bacterium]